MAVHIGRILGVLLITTVCLAQREASQNVRFSTQLIDKPEVGRVSPIDQLHLWVGLEYTTDGGVSWIGRFPPSGVRDFESEVPPRNQTTVFVTANRGWLNGLGRVWKTEDAGASWSAIFDGHFHAMAFHGNSGWMAIGDDNSVRNYITKDRGSTWTSCGVEWKSSQLAPLNSASFIDDRNGWTTVAKYNSLGLPYREGVARTNDGGCTWTATWWNSEVSEKLLDIQFVDKNIGWLAAARGKLRETFDAGLTWRVFPLPRPNFALESIHLIDGKSGWVAGSPSPRIYFSENAVWHVVDEKDLHDSTGLARKIPFSWGDGFLIKINAYSMNLPRH